MTKRLTDVRLSQLAHETRQAARSFTDPKTGTVDVRVLELEAVLDELIVLRQCHGRAAGAILDAATSSPDAHVRGRLRAIAEALLEGRS